MTRFPHDQFAKDYLQELLSPLGTVETSRDVAAEVRSIDVWFQPTPNPSQSHPPLGLLGKLARTPALFEPFRNPITPSEVRSCVGKLFDICAELERQAKREKRRITTEELPRLWILTPTASQTVLTGFTATPDAENWSPGIYLLGKHFRTAIVVIHQLSETPETLWLRILGRGGVQQRAIEELTTLPEANEFRQGALELLYDLQANLAASQRLGKEDRTLVMALAPLYRQRFEAAIQQGIEQGIEQGLERGIERGIEQGIEQGLERGIEQGLERGIEQGLERGIEQGLERGIEQGRIEGQRSVLENFLRVRWGELDPTLMTLLTPVSTLSAAEFAMLLVQVSALSVEENGLESVREILAQTLLKMRFGELDDERLLSLVSRLLALPSDELESFLLQWSQLSDKEILAGLAE